jgi:hypothetical protein
VCARSALRGPKVSTASDVREEFIRGLRQEASAVSSEFVRDCLQFQAPSGHDGSRAESTSTSRAHGDTAAGSASIIGAILFLEN